MSLGDKILLLCKYHGITEKQLSILTGINVNQISRYINSDTDPRASSILKIADALGVSTDYLLREEQDHERG